MLNPPEVYERDDEPGVWSVEQIDDEDGGRYVTNFYGPNSEARAREYQEFLLARDR